MDLGRLSVRTSAATIADAEGTHAQRRHLPNGFLKLTVTPNEAFETRRYPPKSISRSHFHRFLCRALAPRLLKTFRTRVRVGIFTFDHLIYT